VWRSHPEPSIEIAEELGVRRRLIDVDEYHLMGEVGIFEPGERVELIEGEVIRMAPIGGPHAGNVNVLNRLLVVAAGDRAVVSVQNPVRLSRRSEPQRDLALLRPRADHYRAELPGPSDVPLIVEMAESSLKCDRHRPDRLVVVTPRYSRSSRRWYQWYSAR
jgi:hypothetical protein